MSENLVPGSSDFSYLQIFSRGGLTIPSINSMNYVCTAFAILDYSVDTITQFECILCHFSSDNIEQYTCNIHESTGRHCCNGAVTNGFFNNKRKLSTDSRKVNLRFQWP